MLRKRPALFSNLKHFPMRAAYLQKLTIGARSASFKGSIAPQRTSSLPKSVRPTNPGQSHASWRSSHSWRPSIWAILMRYLRECGIPIDSAFAKVPYRSSPTAARNAPRRTKAMTRSQTRRQFFTPDSQCTPLLTELEPDDDLAFGLCDLGLGEPELGDVSRVERSRQTRAPSRARTTLRSDKAISGAS